MGRSNRTESKFRKCQDRNDCVHSLCELRSELCFIVPTISIRPVVAMVITCERTKYLENLLVCLQSINNNKIGRDCDIHVFDVIQTFCRSEHVRRKIPNNARKSPQTSGKARFINFYHWHSRQHSAVVVAVLAGQEKCSVVLAVNRG